MFAFGGTYGESWGTVYFLGSISSFGIGPQPAQAPGLTVQAVFQENLLCLKDRETERCWRDRTGRADPENQPFPGTNGCFWCLADDRQSSPQPYGGVLLSPQVRKPKAGDPVAQDHKARMCWILKPESRTLQA